MLESLVVFFEAGLEGGADAVLDLTLEVAAFAGLLNHFVGQVGGVGSHQVVIAEVLGLKEGVKGLGAVVSFYRIVHVFGHSLM